MRRPRGGAGQSAMMGDACVAPTHQFVKRNDRSLNFSHEAWSSPDLPGPSRTFPDLPGPSRTARPAPARGSGRAPSLWSSADQPRSRHVPVAPLAHLPAGRPPDDKGPVVHPIASRFTPPARPTPYTLHAHHRRALPGPNSWPRHHSSFPDSAHLPGTANAAPRLSRPPSHTFLAIVLALVPLLQTSKMHHDDREMSALGPGTNQLVTIPIPLRQRRSVGCFTYPPMWTRPADRAPSCGPCGQAMEKLTLPYRLPTLGALAPTPSPLLQQRFMEKVTAPAPAGSRITPSSQEIRLRNTPTNSRGDPTRECEKQQAVVWRLLSGGAHVATGERIAALEAVEPERAKGREAGLDSVGSSGRESDASVSEERERTPEPDMEKAREPKAVDRDLGL